MKKNVFFGIVLIFVLIFVFACGTGRNAQPHRAFETLEDGTPQRAELRTPASEAAAVSGKLVIYTSMYEDVFRAVETELETAFPYLDVVFVYGGTGQIQNRIAAEIAAGRLGCDIIMVAEPPFSLELKEKGILHPHISSQAQHLAFEFDEEGYWYPVRVSNMVLAFNPERLSRNDVPNSFYEFAYDTSMRGFISMSNPLTSGTTMAAITALWDRFTNRYFEALGRQNVQFDSGAAALSRLETGELRVIMVLEEQVLRKRQVEGSRLEVIYPADGSVVVPSTISIINDQWNANRNIPAAEAVLDWFLSPAGQNIVVDSWMHSVRADFERYPYESIPTKQILANRMPVIWENAFRERDEIHSRFEQYVVRRGR